MSSAKSMVTHIDEDGNRDTSGSMMMERGRNMVLRCYAEGAPGHCSAICIDLDIAAQGDTLHEAKATLQEMINSYILTVTALPDAAERERLLSRRAPLSVRLKYFSGLFFALLFASGGGPDREGYVSHTACHA